MLNYACGIRDRKYWILAILLAVSFVILMSHQANAAQATIKLSAQGTGSIVDNSDRTWASGDDLQRVRSSDQYTGGTAGQILLTAPGPFQYQTTDTLDARVNNRYTSSEYTKFENGGVFSDSLFIDDNTPNATPIECTAGNLGSESSQTGNPTHQVAGAEYTGLLQAAEVSTSKFVSDANLSIGQQAAWDGAGLYTGDTMYSVEVGGDANTTEMNYRATAHDHFFVSTNMTGGAIVRPEFNFIDFGDAFVTNSTSTPVYENSSNLTSNTTGDKA